MTRTHTLARASQTSHPLPSMNFAWRCFQWDTTSQEATTKPHQSVMVLFDKIWRGVPFPPPPPPPHPLLYLALWGSCLVMWVPYLALRYPRQMAKHKTPTTNSFRCSPVCLITLRAISILYTCPTLYCSLPLLLFFSPSLLAFSFFFFFFPSFIPSFLFSSSASSFPSSFFSLSPLFFFFFFSSSSSSASSSFSLVFLLLPLHLLSSSLPFLFILRRLHLTARDSYSNPQLRGTRTERWHHFDLRLVEYRPCLVTNYEVFYTVTSPLIIPT